jgi:putative ABC transport system permease protein
MIRNYFKIAWRNLKKSKVYSFINIFGLTAGLVSFLLIALYIYDELTYDGFHKKHKDIYRVVETKIPKEGKEKKIVSVAANIAVSAKNDFPEVEDAVRYSNLGRSNVTNDENTKVFYEFNSFAGASFLKIFDFPVLAGDAATALSNPYSVIVTDKTAIKIFGNTNVVGKTIHQDRDSIPFKITAVISIPDNSHLQFNLLYSESSLTSQRFRDFISSDWSSNTFVTYLQISNNSGQTASNLTALVKKNRNNDDEGKSVFSLQPLKAIHFHSAGMEGNTDQPGNLTHLYIFGIVALFVLLIACINYVNLTTARFSGRSKEVAVRKVAGASRESLIGQFMAEASLITLFALVLSLVIVQLLLPWFNQFTGKELSLGWGTDYRIWTGIFLITVLVSVLSGIYPAIFQSGRKPFQLLKSKIQVGKGGLTLRRSLVVFQFSLSIMMIIATMVVYRQMKYVDTANMGFDKNQLLVVDINSGLVRRSAETIKTEFSRIPGVKTVSTTSRVPGEWKVMPKLKVRVPGKLTTPGDDVYFIGVDDQFMKTFEAGIVKGRNFLPATPGDSSSIILNEAAAKMLGIDQPSEQLVEIPSLAFSGNSQTLNQPFQARVIGIVKDFNFQSLREKIAPLILGYSQNPLHSIDYFTARVDVKNIPATLKSMEDVLHKIDPSHLFEYNFLDKQWDLFYREDEKRQIIFLGIAILTIVIACLGLFGLATYAAEQRIKEIGIRKVLGAGVGSIVSMLSMDFLKLVFIAALIAFPLAGWTMNNWLQGFAYRTRMAWWIFLAAGIIAFLIAFLTISSRAVKAALANPVKSLRTE